MARVKMKKKDGTYTKAGLKKMRSAAAKKRPRYKTGPKKGQFKPK